MTNDGRERTARAGWQSVARAGCGRPFRWVALVRRTGGSRWSAGMMGWRDGPIWRVEWQVDLEAGLTHYI